MHSEKGFIGWNKERHGESITTWVTDNSSDANCLLTPKYFDSYQPTTLGSQLKCCEGKIDILSQFIKS
jgi:hypothetical protein